jgi:cytoskeletal protein CcmA (bactofilin family)
MTLEDNGFHDSYLAGIDSTVNRGPSSEHRAMAVWKEPSHARKDPVLWSRDPAPAPERGALDGGSTGPAESASPTVPARVKERQSTESIIAADLTIEGKIEGSGHVRLIGKFKGDVHVEGDLTIEPGAKVTGSVRAGTVVVGGELEGNIEAASRVELLETGVINGDLKAGSLTVAAGSRMRGQADFGWQETEPRAPRMRVETVSTP